MATKLIDYLTTEADKAELDERVIDQKSAEAAEINNQGRDAQIAYLTAEPECSAVKLTQEDWVEIYYALESKMEEIRAGEYGDTTESKRAWVKHLKSIMEKVGPDGETAIERGVEPLGDEDRVTFEGPTGWPDHGIKLDRLIEREG